LGTGFIDASMNVQYSLPGYDHPIIRWLLGKGRRITESMSFLGAFAEQLRQRHRGRSSGDRSADSPPAGLLLQRDMGARQGCPGATQFCGRELALSSGAQPRKDDLRRGEAVRCDLTAAATEGEYGIYTDLRRDGFIDYFATAVPFSDGSNKALIVATK
jgi:hypothetical protein